MLSYHHVVLKEHGRRVGVKVVERQALDWISDKHTLERGRATELALKTAQTTAQKTAQKTIIDGARAAKMITSIQNRLYRKAGDCEAAVTDYSLLII